jgi:hypothetical protein
MKNKLLALIVLGILFSTLCHAQINTKPVAQPYGRFQIVMCQGVSPLMCSFLLDTSTGQTWQLVDAPDGVAFWEPNHKVDTLDEDSAFLNRHSAPPKKESK